MQIEIRKIGSLQLRPNQVRATNDSAETLSSNRPVDLCLIDSTRSNSRNLLGEDIIVRKGGV